MKLEPYEKRAFQFLFHHSTELSGFDADSLVVVWRSNNPYATTLYFAHDEDENNLAARSALAGDFFLKHPERDDYVDVSIDIIDNVPVAAEIVPLGMEALPSDISEFVFVKVEKPLCVEIGEMNE